MTIVAYTDLQRLRAAGPAKPAAPSVGHHLVSARRVLQLALAAIWLLDAALQYQPYMFTKGFVTTLLAPAAAGNPAVIAAPMRWLFHLMIGHPAAFNAVFATIQLAIAAGLIWRRTVKIALAASIAWAVGVWWFGEGLGGVLTGVSPIMGAPGAVILYALVALVIWPRDDTAVTGSVSDHGMLGRRGAGVAWTVLWGALAYLFLIPTNRAPGALHDTVTGMTSGEPASLTGLERDIATIVAGHGTAISIALAVACDLIALSVFLPRLARVGVVAAAMTGLLVWTAQAFGGIFTGRGTDPNTGLLLILVAAAYWPLTRRADNAITPRERPSALIESHRLDMRPLVLARRHRPRLALHPRGLVLERAIRPVASTVATPGRSTSLSGRASAAEPPRTTKGPGHRLGLFAVLAVLVTGCAAAYQSGGPAPVGPASGAPMPAGMVMTGVAPMPGGMAMGSHSATPAAPSPTAGPSESARMVCSSEISRDLTTALALPALPSATTTWADHLYTCTYHLQGGPLVIAVKELKDVPAARAYLERMNQSLAPTQPILGLANLGLPGYQTSNGTVIFAKDDKTLEVDASALPAPIGPNRVSRTDLAYQIATDILGCWTGK